MRVPLAILCGLLCLVASSATAARSVASDTGDTTVAGAAGCAPDPDTAETYCGERDAEAPEATALRSEAPARDDGG